MEVDLFFLILTDRHRAGVFPILGVSRLVITMPQVPAPKRPTDPLEASMTKLFWIGGSGGHEEEDSGEGSTTKILMEVVSAQALDFTKFERKIDPSCHVLLGKDKSIHRTESVRNDPDPIWTVKTKSLCLLNIPNDWKESFEETDKIVSVELCHGNLCIGLVTVPIQEILEKNGEREEYDVKVNPTYQTLESPQVSRALWVVYAQQVCKV